MADDPQNPASPDPTAAGCCAGPVRGTDARPAAPAAPAPGALGDERARESAPATVARSPAPQAAKTAAPLLGRPLQRRPSQLPPRRPSRPLARPPSRQPRRRRRMNRPRPRRHRARPIRRRPPVSPLPPFIASLQAAIPGSVSQVSYYLGDWTIIVPVGTAARGRAASARRAGRAVRLLLGRHRDGLAAARRALRRDLHALFDSAPASRARQGQGLGAAAAARRSRASGRRPIGSSARCSTCSG